MLSFISLPSCFSASSPRPPPQVAEPCPNCDYHELRFYTMQMRSVDEGQTVFYECEKCGHTYSTNT
jgi:DNA-directed RNA polymerase subunit M/transcription elongation factor TFIIS